MFVYLIAPSDPEIPQPPAPPPSPCVPQCGPNAECKVVNGVGRCTCISGFYGVPEFGCTPECVRNQDCRPDQACVEQQCIDPCVSVCGVRAECQVVNHNPICSCPQNFIGDPFTFCEPPPPGPPGMMHFTLSVQLFTFSHLIYNTVQCLNHS